MNKMMNLDFSKSEGLIPAVVQDIVTEKVLLVGFMNEEAYQKTRDSKMVTLYSRTHRRLWTQGEDNGHYLDVVELLADSNNESLLIKAHPRHAGSETRFGEGNSHDDMYFLGYLQNFITARRSEMPEESYTTKLFKSGINKIAQKVGEEAVELVIEAKDQNDELFLNEAADLMYHFIVLLTARGYGLKDVATVLRTRHQKQ
jgi:phosphoribosyl-ATP pyrophosphohydrolase/phosphoribosyl-AMP cyclohydrolase